MKVGDRVRYIKDDANKIQKGDTGTIKYISPSAYIGVEWDKNIHGHDGQLVYIGKGGFCWNVAWTDIEKIDETPIKIKWYSKGRFSKWEEDK